MNFCEAMRALNNGKPVRIKSWDKDQRWEFRDGFLKLLTTTREGALRIRDTVFMQSDLTAEWEEFSPDMRLEEALAHLRNGRQIRRRLSTGKEFDQTDPYQLRELDADDLLAEDWQVVR